MFKSLRNQSELHLTQDQVFEEVENLIHRYGLQEPLPSRPQRFLDETYCSEFMAHELLSFFGGYIAYFKNPSEALCLSAVHRSFEAIKHIQSPSEAVSMAHEECWGEMIRNRKSLHEYFKDTTDFSVVSFARIK